MTSQDRPRCNDAMFLLRQCQEDLHREVAACSWTVRVGSARVSGRRFQRCLAHVRDGRGLDAADPTSPPLSPTIPFHDYSPPCQPSRKKKKLRGSSKERDLQRQEMYDAGAPFTPTEPFEFEVYVRRLRRLQERGIWRPAGFSMYRNVKVHGDVARAAPARFKSKASPQVASTAASSTRRALRARRIASPVPPFAEQHLRS